MTKNISGFKIIVAKREQNMVSIGFGRIINRISRANGKVYDRFFLYLPVDVARDERFPFKADEKVMIRIDEANKRLIVEKAP